MIKIPSSQFNFLIVKFLAFSTYVFFLTSLVSCSLSNTHSSTDAESGVPRDWECENFQLSQNGVVFQNRLSCRPSKGEKWIAVKTNGLSNTTDIVSETLFKVVKQPDGSYENLEYSIKEFDPKTGKTTRNDIWKVVQQPDGKFQNFPIGERSAYYGGGDYPVYFELYKNQCNSRYTTIRKQKFSPQEGYIYGHLAINDLLSRQCPALWKEILDKKEMNFGLMPGLSGGNVTLLSQVLASGDGKDWPDSSRLECNGSFRGAIGNKGISIEVVKMILDKGANPNEKSSKGFSALDIAKCNGHSQEMIDILQQSTTTKR